MRLEFDGKSQVATDGGQRNVTTHFGTQANAKNGESHGSQSLKEKALIDLESRRILWKMGIDYRLGKNARGLKWGSSIVVAVTAWQQENCHY
jgi:hypothetical protein